MGSPTKEMTDEERALLQELVDISFTSFKTIVQDGRPEYKENPAALDAVATGQIFTASQAVENGLVDKIGFIEEAIERAAELAGRSTDDLRCVEYHQQVTPIDALLGAHAPGNRRSSVDLASLLDLTTPRAYFLYTWLPSMLTNTRP
jgi:protease-4